MGIKSRSKLWTCVEREGVSRIAFDHGHCLATDNLTATFFIEICSSLDAITLVLSTAIHEAVAMEEDEELKSCFPNCWHRLTSQCRVHLDESVLR